MRGMNERDVKVAGGGPNRKQGRYMTFHVIDHVMTKTMREGKKGLTGEGHRGRRHDGRKEGKRKIGMKKEHFIL